MPTSNTMYRREQKPKITDVANCKRNETISGVRAKTNPNFHSQLFVFALWTHCIDTRTPDGVLSKPSIAKTPVSFTNFDFSYFSSATSIIFLTSTYTENYKWIAHISYEAIRKKFDATLCIHTLCCYTRVPNTSDCFMLCFRL